MANDYFKFRQFTVRQHRCAMKVGTDGTLLGCWAQAPSGNCRVLDIGTGTGLIALMMAQRFPNAEVVGIDIDNDAVLQAKENVMASPFSNRIQVIQVDAAEFQSEPFDVIVSNPPYFTDSLICPDDQRTLARHTVSLSYKALMYSAYRLLKEDGRFSLVIPAGCRFRLEEEASMANFMMSRICAIKTTPNKAPKRYLIEFQKKAVTKIDMSVGIIEDSPGCRSRWYTQLTKDFYL